MAFIRHVLKSVFPKAFALGVLGSLLSLLFWILKAEFDFEVITSEDVKDGRLYTVYSFALGFLVVFRNGQAFSRWWAASQTLAVLMTEWLDGCSQLIAATTNSKKGTEKVMAFNHVMCRLFSLLSCVSFKHMADSKNENYHILNVDCLDDQSRDILWNLDEEPSALMDVVGQWILNCIHCGVEDGIVVAAAPIVTRAFAELAKATEHVETLAGISQTKIPWPYSAMLNSLLVIHMFYTAMLASLLQVDNRVFMVVVVFVSVFVFQCINLIACEIEHPFGDDVNDIDLHCAQDSFNARLRILLDSRAYHKPWCKSVETMRNIDDSPSTKIFDPAKQHRNVDHLHDSKAHGKPSANGPKINARRPSLGEHLQGIDAPVANNVSDAAELSQISTAKSRQVAVESPAKVLDDNQWWRELGLDMRQLLQQLVEHHSYAAALGELNPIRQVQQPATSSVYGTQPSSSLASSLEVRPGEERLVKQGLDLPCSKALCCGSEPLLLPRQPTF